MNRQAPPVMRRPRMVDVLLILTSVILGAYLLINRDAPTTQERIARADHLLTRFSAQSLKRLTLHSKDETFSILAEENEPGEYRLEGDLEGRADAALVRQLLSALEFATFKRKLDGRPPSLAPGADPELTLEVAMDQQTSKISFLSATRTSAQTKDGEIYVEVQQNGGPPQFGVVSEQLFTTFNRSKQEFRGGRLFPFSIEATSALEVASASHKFRLVADELGFLLSENHLRADRTLVDVLFFHLAAAKIETFVTPAEASRAVLEDPHHLTIEQQGPGKDVIVRIGGSCPGVEGSILAHRTTAPEVAGCISQSILAGIGLSGRQLIDETATFFTSDEIDHVIVSGPDQSLDLIRKDAGFLLLSRDSQSVPLEVGNEYLQRLSRGKLNLTDAPESPGGPAITLSIVGNPRQKALDPAPWEKKKDTGAGPGHRLQVEIFETKNPPLLHRLDDDAWLEIPASLAWVFSADDAWARSRDLSLAEPSSVDWVQIEYFEPTQPSAGPTTLRVEKKEDDYIISGGARSSIMPADPTLGRRLFEQLAHLEAVRFYSETAQPSPLSFRLDFGTWNDPNPHRLLVGGRVRGGFLAWSDLSKTQFVLPYDIGMALSTPVYDRQAAQVEPDRFSHLELASEGRVIELERVAGALESKRGDVADDTVAELLAELRGLQVLAHLPEMKMNLKGPPLLEIRGSEKGAPDYALSVVKLAPFQDGYAYYARVAGEPGLYALSAASVRALLVLL